MADQALNLQNEICMSDYLREVSTKTVAFCLLVLTALLISCDSQRVYDNSIQFEDRTWKVVEEPRFEFTIMDTTQTYNLYYSIRNSLDYPYARIFVTYHLYDSVGKEITKKLLFNDLFDQKTGAPFGESGLGDLYDHRFPILHMHPFGYPGKYSLKLDQFTRQDTLKGVVAVGVRVEKATAN